MKNILLSGLAIISCAFTCEDRKECAFDHDRACNVQNPVTELAWLSDRIEEINQSAGSEHFYVQSAQYLTQDVFIIENCCPDCLTLPPPVYNCEGTLLGRVGTGKDDINPSLLKNETIVWKPDNFTCNVE